MLAAEPLSPDRIYSDDAFPQKIIAEEGADLGRGWWPWQVHARTREQRLRCGSSRHYSRDTGNSKKNNVTHWFARKG
jgi:hypothetical protein